MKSTIVFIESFPDYSFVRVWFDRNTSEPYQQSYRHAKNDYNLLTRPLLENLLSVKNEVTTIYLREPWKSTLFQRGPTGSYEMATITHMPDSDQERRFKGHVLTCGNLKMRNPFESIQKFAEDDPGGFFYQRVLISNPHGGKHVTI